MQPTAISEFNAHFGQFLKTRVRPALKASSLAAAVTLGGSFWLAATAGTGTGMAVMENALGRNDLAQADPAIVEDITRFTPNKTDACIEEEIKYQGDLFYLSMVSTDKNVTGNRVLMKDLSYAETYQKCTVRTGKMPPNWYKQWPTHLRNKDTNEIFELSYDIVVMGRDNGAPVYRIYPHSNEVQKLVKKVIHKKPKWSFPGATTPAP